MKLSFEEVERLVRWAARCLFVEHARRVRRAHPSWSACEVIEHLERWRILVLDEHPPGQYWIRWCVRPRPEYVALCDLSMPSDDEGIWNSLWRRALLQLGSMPAQERP